MEQVNLQPIAKSHGDQFEVCVGGDVVGTIGWRQLSDLTVRQLANVAPSCILLKDGTSLAVYERRTHPGVAGSGDALQVEIGEESMQLSAHAAHQLACVLLAYAGQENQRGQWLVRLESGQG